MLYYNLQGCCQSAVVAWQCHCPITRRIKDHTALMPLHQPGVHQRTTAASPPPSSIWNPQVSASGFFWWKWKRPYFTLPHPHCLSVCRLVLGSHFSEWCSGSSSGKIWRDVPHEGQHSSQTHADPVGEDLLWTHQCAHWVQQGLLLAGLRWAAVQSDLPRRPQPRAALHDFGPRATVTQRHVPKGEVLPS